MIKEFLSEDEMTIPLYSVYAFMRQMIPSIVYVFTTAETKSVENGSLSLNDAEKIKQQTEQIILPNLNRAFREVNSQQLLIEGDQTNRTELFRERANKKIFAIVLDIGLLAPIFPTAFLTLDCLLSSDILPVRISAALALISLGRTPKELDIKGLEFTINTGWLFEIPLRTFTSVIAGLKPYFQDNLDLLSALLNVYKNNQPYWQMHNKAEVAIMFGELGICDQDVMYELMNWYLDFDGYSPYYQEYKERTHKTIVSASE